MAGYKDTDYLHISARSRVLESKLLSADSLVRLAAAQSFDDAFRMLKEQSFGESFSGEAPSLGNNINNQSDVRSSEIDEFSDSNVQKTDILDKLLVSELAECYSFLNSMLVDKSLLLPFMLPSDFMNIKALLKAEILGIPPDKMLFGTGSVGVEEMKKAVRERDRRVLDKYMYEAVERSLLSYSGDGDPQSIDIITDGLCIEDILYSAEISGFDFLVGYFKAKSDIINIQSFVRLKIIGKPASFFEKVFVSGNIGIAFYEKQYSKPLPEFFGAIGHTDYFEISEFENEQFSMTKFEKKLDDMMCEIIKKLRLVPFGPQVPVSFLLSKEAEVKNIRIIMSGKAAGLSGEMIKERLRLGYV